jgi:hypothetical protein
MAYFGVSATGTGIAAAAGGDLAAGLGAVLGRVAPDAPVVVLVHGWKFDPGRRAADPHRSLYAFRPTVDRRIRSWPAGLGIADDAGESGLAIGFAWPASASHLASLVACGRTGFATVYDRAGVAGVALAALLRLVQTLAPGRRIDVLAHSLGARVALAALPHLDRTPERMILLGAAELAARAEAFVVARAPDERPAIYNVTARTNDLYDLAFECFVPARRPGERASGAGLPGLACWLDLQLDRPEVAAWARVQGVPLSPETARCCHWNFYTREGAFALYQAILRRRPGWDIESLRRLPCLAGQEPRWSRLLPRRRPLGPDAPDLAGVAFER